MVINNGHMKGFIKLATKLSIKHMLNTGIICKMKMAKKTGDSSGKYLISLYSARVSQVVKIIDTQNYSKILRMIQSSKIK